MENATAVCVKTCPDCDNSREGRKTLIRLLLAKNRIWYLWHKEGVPRRLVCAKHKLPRAFRGGKVPATVKQSMQAEKELL